MPNVFQIDVEKIRADARQHIEDGAVTGENKADTERIIEVLQQVVATEMVCYLRYTQNATQASGIDRAQVSAQFIEQAGEELEHFHLATERINQLGGTPDLNPATIATRAHTQYGVPKATDLEGMLKENLVAERTVIEIYAEMIRWIGDADPTTRRMIEHILAEEEEHADELKDLLGI
jgi:bacterioferritin